MQWRIAIACFAAFLIGMHLMQFAADGDWFRHLFVGIIPWLSTLPSLLETLWKQLKD